MAKKRKTTKRKTTTKKTSDAKTRRTPKAVKKKTARRKSTTESREGRVEYVSMPSEVEYSRAKQAYLKYRTQLLKCDKRVTGLSMGSRFRSGRSTGQFAIRLHVATQSDKDDLKQKVIDRSIDLKEFYDGVPIDIIVCPLKPVTNGNSIPDGTAIESANKLSGTLGTTVRRGGDLFWITAAHVVSEGTITSDTNIKRDGRRIGHVPADDEFWRRDQFVDCAMIVPQSRPGLPPFGRGTRRVTDNDAGNRMSVEMNGAVSGHVFGRVDSVLHEPMPLTDGTSVEDHFLVVTDSGGSFAQGGDSGAIVTIGDFLVGQIRAATPSDAPPPRFTVASQIMNIMGQLLFMV